MTVLTIIGTRPQLIKSQLVSLNLKNLFIKEYIINTKQHYDKNLNQIFYNEDNKINSLFTNKPTSKENTLAKLVLYIKKINPKLIIVYGDTNSTLLGAISASVTNINILHIEAGLRSYNKNMPEEVNRIIVDNLSKYLVCPSENAYKNLLNEGFDKKNIFKIGDPSFDIFKSHKNKCLSKTKLYKKFNLSTDKFVLLTLHRNTNVDLKKRLILILKFLKESNLNLVFPIHPRTKSQIKKFKLSISHNIKVIDPLNHIDLLSMIKHADFIITDSGGVQREAYFSKKKSFILRDDYEWKELFEHKQSFIIKTSEFTKNYSFNKKFVYKENLLGNGNISFKIAKLVKNLIV